MSGFDNDIVFAKNADFTQTDNQSVSESNGLVTNGQLWIGATAVNAGGTHINVGAITSIYSTISVGYSSPNVTIDSINAVVFIKYENLNGLVNAVTTIFTPTTDFVVTEEIVRLKSVSGVAAGDFSATIGTNAATYDNIGSSIVITGSTTNSTTVNLASGNGPYVTSGTPIRINVSSPESTATTYTLDVFIVGYYNR